MASPQKENGHIVIANELWEALLKLNIPSEPRRIFDAIIRKTWGWNKKADRISLSQLEELTGVSNPNVCRALRWLKKANMIVRDNDKTSIQKDYEKWQLPDKALSNETLSNEIATTVCRDNKPLSNETDTKDNTKNTIQKTIPEGEKKASGEADIFPKGAWTDSRFFSVLGDWNARRTQTAHPFDVAVYYFLKFHSKHRSLTDLELEHSRKRIWEKEKKTWLNISKLDPLDDFVTTAICDMALKGNVIDEPIPFFRWAKKTYQGADL